ncbi:MAG: hypothetical protein AAGD32_07695 [Planctomycetota bacterium]
MHHVDRLPFELPCHDLMGRVEAVGEAAGGMIPGEVDRLTQAVADAVRATDIGSRRYALSRAGAMTLSLWNALQGHSSGRNLRIALFRLYLALTGGHSPRENAALPLAA